MTSLGPEYQGIPLENIFESEDNVRKRHTGISDLADSIVECGLLQNLVVSPQGLDGYYLLHAGSRRLRALRLLTERGTPYNPDEFGRSIVPCLVGDGLMFHWDNLVENVKRAEVPLWHVGMRFNELRERGFTQEEIAAKCSVKQGYVSRACTLAAGLHPQTIKRLDSINSSVLNQTDLQRLSRITDDKLHPCPERQREYLERLIKRGAVKRSRGRHVSTHKDQVYRRFNRLKGNGVSRLPKATQPIVERVLEYLDGTRKRMSFD